MRKIVDSGVDWIGSIPAGWTIRKCKHLFEILKRIAGREGIDVLSVTQRGLRIKDIESGNGQLADDYSGYQLVYPGDFVMNHMDLLTGWIDCSKLFGVTSPDYRVFRPKKNIPADNRFYKFLFQYCYSNKVFYNLGNGVADKGRWRLQASAFKNFSVPLPPYEEQRHIANHLDGRCGAIDEAKKIIEDEIESLRRLRKATIFKAVTKGVNDAVPMRDSGVDWIGMIPAHWDCCKQKHAIRLINGRAYANEEFELDGKYRILRVGNLFSNPDWYTSSLELPRDKYCNEGDLLYSWSMSYGPHIWHGEKVIYHYHIWKVNLSSKLSKTFAYYYLLALTGAIQSEVHETTMGFLTMGAMNNSYIALPPIKEQEAIVDYLDEHCTAIDSIIDARTKQLERLEDYRKALIYAYVTGKKEVPVS